MAEDPKISSRDLRLARICGAVLAVVGCWLLFHGGLSLLGGFGLERHMRVSAGQTPPSVRRLGAECLGGLALLLAGVALHLKAKRMAPKDTVAEDESPPEGSYRAVMAKANTVAIVAALAWIVYMVILIATD